MIAQHLVIVIHVHEGVTEFARLIDSIDANHRLRQYPVLVVNNAHERNAAKSISDRAACRTFSLTKEINRSSWRRLRKQTLTRFGSPATRECLYALDLGRSGWSVHDARNVGMIAAVLLYPRCTHVFNLDSDIVVPDDLEVHDTTLPGLSGLHIRGCPDLSRLEWLELYCRLAGTESGVRLPSDSTYAFRLAQSLSSTDLLTSMRCYTDLFGSTACVEGDPLSFPSRDDYHGGCYLLSIERFAISPVPWWPDNDFFLFWMVRRIEEKIDFLDGCVLHASARKNILEPSMLKREEEGKIFNTLYRGAGSVSMDEAIAFSQNRIDRILNFLDETARQWPFGAPAVSYERTYQAMIALRSQIEFPAATALREFKRFEQFRKCWSACLGELTRWRDPPTNEC